VLDVRVGREPDLAGDLHAFRARLHACEGDALAQIELLDAVEPP